MFEIINNEIHFMRAGEAVIISSCGKNSIRFRSSANCHITDENWTLLPCPSSAKAWAENDRAILETGIMRAEIYGNGKVIYYSNGKKIIEELPELTFGAQIRNYRCLDGGVWNARVAFKSNDDEHFYGLGHEATGCFDLKAQA